MDHSRKALVPSLPMLLVGRKGFDIRFGSDIDLPVMIEKMSFPYQLRNPIGISYLGLTGTEKQSYPILV
jgi:hypothetical protein